jgi:hypothetical protein
MSAFGGKANIAVRDRHVRYWLPVQPVDATLALNLPHAGLLGNKGKMAAY